MNAPERTAKDLLIAFRHPRFDGVRPIEAIRTLKQNRGEYVWYVIIAARIRSRRGGLGAHSGIYAMGA